MSQQNKNENRSESDLVVSSIAKPFSRRAFLDSALGAAGVAAVGLATPAAIAAAPVEKAKPALSGAPMLIATATGAVADTAAGKVRGYIRNGIFTFKGITYGAPTGGEARFTRATNPAPWAGVRDCLWFGPVAPQRARTGWSNQESAFVFEWDDGQPGEDCLRANVWTPSLKNDRKRPVMVWIHGGGFQAGSSQELKSYDGENISRRGDLVLVSINHRLNVLGFLNLAQHGDRYADSGNVGMLDIVLALEWVKANIANFGGDPGNVTIFGQSGGGGKVTTLMAMPSAKGLFHRAIVQSGSMNRQATVEASQKLSAYTLAQLGIGPDQIDKLHTLPTQALEDAGAAAYAKLDPDPGTPIRRHSKPWWSPVVDGRELPQHPFDSVAPPYSANVPMLIGTVRDEAMNGIGRPEVEAMTEADLKTQMLKLFGNDKGSAILDAYRHAYPTAKPFDVLSIATGSTVRQAALKQATVKSAQNGAPAFLYWFCWKTPVLDGRPRAFHCSDLPFSFSNVDRCAAMTGGTPEAHKLGAEVGDAFINFAHSGNPNHAGLPKWDAFNAQNQAVMVFDNETKLKNNPDPEIKLVPEA